MNKGTNPLIGEFEYFFSLAERENNSLYHYIKGREVNWDKEAHLVDGLIPQIVSELGPRKTVVIPDSSCGFIGDISERTAETVIRITKRTKEEIKKTVESLPLQKKERERFQQSFHEMGEDFKINRIKSNQRWRFEEIMFDWGSVPAFDVNEAIFLDDSLFSGHTAAFAKSQLGISHVIVIFSKWR